MSVKILVICGMLACILPGCAGSKSAHWTQNTPPLLPRTNREILAKTVLSEDEAVQLATEIKLNENENDL